MRTLYNVLGALALVLLGIFIGVGYVWYQIAFAPKSISTVPEHTVAQVSQSDTASTSSTTSTLPAKSTPMLKSPIQIATSTLSEGQKALLETLGVDATNLVITPTMQLCAVNALGQVRVREIEKGATPTISEGLTLLVCYKK